MPRRCWICGRSRANEAFGGTGRKQGICRACWPKRPRDREELNLLRDLRRLEPKGYVRADAPTVVRRILASHHEGLRREAAWLIAPHLPSRGMLDLAIEHARADPDIDVRIACLHALGAGMDNFVAIHEEGLDDIPNVIGSRAAMRAKELLLDIARDRVGPEACRFAAVAALGLLSYEPEVAREIESLFDLGTTGALCAALEAAGRRYDVHWDHRIVPCLSHPDAEVRRLAAHAANACWVQDGHDALRRLCCDADAETAAEALMAFERIGDIDDVAEVLRAADQRRSEEFSWALSQANEYVELRQASGGAPLDADDDFDDDLPF